MQHINPLRNKCKQIKRKGQNCIIYNCCATLNELQCCRLLSLAYRYAICFAVGRIISRAKNNKQSLDINVQDQGQREKRRHNYRIGFTKKLQIHRDWFHLQQNQSRLTLISGGLLTRTTQAYFAVSLYYC